MSKLVFNNNSLFYISLKKLDKLLKKKDNLIIMDLTQEGLEIINSNNEHLLIKIFIHKNQFQEYNFDDTLITIDSSIFLKNINYLIDKKNEISLFYEDNNIILKSEQDTIKFPCFSCDEISTFPNILDKYDYFIDINSKIFNKKISIISKINDDIFINLKNDELEMDCHNIRNIETNFVIGGNTNKEINDDLKNNYDSKLITDISGFYTFSDKLNIYLKKDFPIFLNYQNLESYANLILAPKEKNY